MPEDILACAAVELLQPYDGAKPGVSSRDSPVGLIHMRLLDLVSHALFMHFRPHVVPGIDGLTNTGVTPPPESPVMAAEVC